jgi:hypothetical protein
MITRKVLTAIAALSLIAPAAMAETSSGTKKNTRHYSAGPKTEVPDHTDTKATVGTSKNLTSGGHHNANGPHPIQ